MSCSHTRTTFQPRRRNAALVLLSLSRLSSTLIFKDGDNVFTTFDDKNHYLIGGTGKYKVITGTVPYTVVGLHETVGGRTAWIVSHKATWEIK